MLFAIIGNKRLAIRVMVIQSVCPNVLAMGSIILRELVFRLDRIKGHFQKSQP